MWKANCGLATMFCLAIGLGGYIAIPGALKREGGEGGGGCGPIFEKAIYAYRKVAQSSSHQYLCLESICMQGGRDMGQKQTHQRSDPLTRKQMLFGDDGRPMRDAGKDEGGNCGE